MQEPDDDLQEMVEMAHRPVMVEDIHLRIDEDEDEPRILPLGDLAEVDEHMDEVGEAEVEHQRDLSTVVEVDDLTMPEQVKSILYEPGMVVV
jgi:hypothetical protein